MTTTTEFNLAEIISEVSSYNVSVKLDIPRKASLMLNNPLIENFSSFLSEIIKLRNKCNNDSISITVYITNIYTTILEDDYGKSILKKIEYYTHFVTN